EQTNVLMEEAIAAEEKATQHTSKAIAALNTAQETMSNNASTIQSKTIATETIPTNSIASASTLPNYAMPNIIEKFQASNEQKISAYPFWKMLLIILVLYFCYVQF